jgi:SPIRAL1-like protein
VLAPPGGASNWSIGGGGGGGGGGSPRNAKNQVAPAPPPQQQQQGGFGQQQQQGQGQESFGRDVRQGSSNAYASGSNQNVGNFLSDRATSRVLAPPGGASNFSF